MMTFSRKQHILWQIILYVIILINIKLLKSDFWGLIFGIIYLIFNAKILSDIYFSHIKQGLKNLLGLTIILTYIALCYTLAYHFYKIDHWIFLWTFTTIPLIIEGLSLYNYTTHYFLKNFNLGIFHIKKLRYLLPILLFLAIDVVLLWYLNNKASGGIIRSPWEVVSYKFWVLFVFSTLLLAIATVNKKYPKNILLYSLHFFLISTVGILIYKNGFGYDSFIHQATLKTISETGTIEPRLFLYMGQYGIELFLSSLMHVSTTTVDKFLLPTLFALFWPCSVFCGFRYSFRWSESISYLAILFSIFVGLNFSTMTTPQNFVFLLFSVAIFIMPKFGSKEVSLYILWILTILSLLIHPLGGIPLFFIATILSMRKIRKPNWIGKKSHYPLIILGAFSLPALFTTYELLKGKSIEQIMSLKLWPLFTAPYINWYQEYNFPFDFLYNIGSNYIWLYIYITLLGFYYIFKENKNIFFKRHFLLLVILILNYILSSSLLSFDSQISYEKQDYLNRILFLIALTTLPIFLTPIYFWFKDEIKNENNFWARSLIVVVATIVVSIGTYFSFPVYDRHGNSKTFGISDTDIKTIQFIDEYSQENSYIVLANQMMGAAAIKEFGFAHYYNNNFYYSMPLGNDNIYQNFITMIEGVPSHEEALKAMDKAGVDKLFLVVNNYWHSAKNAIAQAEEMADEKIMVDDGVNIVFVYNR